MIQPCGSTKAHDTVACPSPSPHLPLPCQRCTRRTCCTPTASHPVSQFFPRTSSRTVSTFEPPPWTHYTSSKELETAACALQCCTRKNLWQYVAQIWHTADGAGRCDVRRGLELFKMVVTFASLLPRTVPFAHSEDRASDHELPYSCDRKDRPLVPTVYKMGSTTCASRLHAVSKDPFEHTVKYNAFHHEDFGVTVSSIYLRPCKGRPGDKICARGLVFRPDFLRQLQFHRIRSHKRLCTGTLNSTSALHCSFNLWHVV